MAYKIQSKVNIYNPRVEPGVIIDDSGNIYLNNVTAREINQVPNVSQAPSIGESYSFITAGGGFANPLSPSAPARGILTPISAPDAGLFTTTSPPDPSVVLYDSPSPSLRVRTIDPLSATDPGGRASTLEFVSLDLIQRFPYAISSASATQLGDVSGTSSGYAFAAGHQSQTHGYVSGGAANNVTFPHGLGGELHYELVATDSSGNQDIDPNNQTAHNYYKSGGKGYIGTGELNGTPSATWEGPNLCDPSDPISPQIYIGRVAHTTVPNNYPTPANPVLGGTDTHQPYTAVPYMQPIHTSAPVLAYPGLGHFATNPKMPISTYSHNLYGLPSTKITRTKTTAPFYFPYSEFTSAPESSNPIDDYKYTNSFMYELVGYNANIKDDINKFPFSIGPSGSGTDVGQLSFEVVKAGGHSSFTHAYVSGGAIKGFPNPAASAFVPYNTEYNQTPTGIPYAEANTMTFETKVYSTDGGTPTKYWPVPSGVDGAYPVVQQEGDAGTFTHPFYVANTVPSANLELAFVTNKIQYYPFAISSAVAEVSAGDLGLFETWEAQSGRTGIPFGAPFDQKGNVAGLDGRPIFYGRFMHGSGSSAFDGYTVGGQIAGVVVNEQFAAPDTNNLSSRTPEGLHYHYRIMTPANFMQRVDYVESQAPPAPFTGKRFNRVQREAGEIFTDGDLYGSNPYFVPSGEPAAVLYQGLGPDTPETNAPRYAGGPGGIAAPLDNGHPDSIDYFYSLPDGVRMNNSGWAPYIGSASQSPSPEKSVHRIPDSYSLKADIVNSDILKFPFSSAATVSVVGQLASYGSGSSQEFPTPLGFDEDHFTTSSSAQRALTNRDEITVVSGPSDMYVLHSHNNPHPYAQFGDANVLVKYPYTNLTPSVVADVYNTSIGVMAKTATQSDTHGFLSGGNEMGMAMSSGPKALQRQIISSGLYRKEVYKFPFSSFGDVSDVGDLAAFTSNAIGIND